MGWTLIEGEEATRLAHELGVDNPDDVVAIQKGGRCGWVYYRNGYMECRICGDCDIDRGDWEREDIPED